MTSIVVTNSMVPAGAPIDSRDTRQSGCIRQIRCWRKACSAPSQLGNGWVTTVALRPGEPVTLSEVEKPSLSRHWAK